MEMEFYTVKDLTEMGFGNRVTIWKKVKNKEFPAPLKFGNSINSPNKWVKTDIDKHLKTLHMIAKQRSVFYGNKN